MMGCGGVKNRHGERIDRQMLDEKLYGKVIDPAEVPANVETRYKTRPWAQQVRLLAVEAHAWAIRQYRPAIAGRAVVRLGG
jgi:hypothetical protein